MDKVNLISEHFTCSEHNALWVALHEAAAEAGNVGIYNLNGQEQDLASIVYEWLDETPRTSMVCSLIEKLHARDFHIIKKEDEGNVEPTSSFWKTEAHNWRKLFEEQRGGEAFNELQNKLAETRQELDKLKLELKNNTK